jgi:hypothetical protein
MSLTGDLPLAIDIFRWSKSPRKFPSPGAAARSMYAEEVALTLQALARYNLGNPTVPQRRNSGTGLDVTMLP